jgi:hypothetical protein
VTSFLLFLSVCTNESTERSWPLLTTMYIFQVLSHYYIKLPVDTHCWICYIAIITLQQPYISVSVSCDTKEHQYTFRNASYSTSHSHTAICYIAISNIQQPYTSISVSVSCDTKDHQYSFRTASYNRSHSHTAICYIAISNIQHPYISVFVWCDTKEHQYTFRTARYSRSHNHTAETDWHQPN